MNADDEGVLLRRAAERASSRPEFLAWTFARYEDLEAVRDDRLQAQLGVAADHWPRLKLCLRPRADTFLHDLTQIAAAFGIDRADLAAVIRRIDAVEVLRASERPGAAGNLLAARSRRKKGRASGGGEVSDDRHGT